MPKATKQYSASRRTLLGGIAASVAVSARAETSPDARLIAAVDEIIAVEAKSDAIWEPYLTARGDVPSHIRAECAALSGRYLDLMIEVGHLRAVTPEGLKAKARAAMTKFHFADECVEDSDEFVAWSLCRDILGGAA